MAPSVASATTRSRAPSPTTSPDVRRAPERFANSTLDAIRRTASTVEALRDTPTSLERTLGERPPPDDFLPDAVRSPTDSSEEELHVPSSAPASLDRAHFAPTLGSTVTASSDGIGRANRVAPVKVVTPLDTEDRLLGTLVDYRVGAPERPPIRHDNGFLQNPDDSADPVPIDTVPPTRADRDYHGSQVLEARVGGALSDVPFIDRVPIPFTDKDQFLDSPNAIDAYGHFLTGEGADRHFDYGDFVADDPSGAAVLDAVTADTRTGIEALYDQAITGDPSLADRPITFEITGGAISVGGPGSDLELYPQTDDWQKAIGGHTVWSSATVTATPGENGGPPSFTAEITVHGEDRYNFNPDQHDIETGAPDALRGRLEEVGLAHQYDHFGETTVEVNWTPGDVDSGRAGGWRRRCPLTRRATSPGRTIRVARFVTCRSGS